ncbi:MAG: protein-export chaperone SecB [Lactococcus plantarum]|nr:protein-export chaperone SecB [Lactococcus plantarum]
MNDPVIQFEQYRIEKINYCIIDDNDTTEYKLKLSTGVAIAEDGKTGRVQFDLSLPDKQNNRKIDVVISGYFTFREDINKENDKQKFLSVNGAAILFPYLRTVVSMVTVLDKNEAILFPTLNFQEMMKESESNE